MDAVAENAMKPLAPLVDAPSAWIGAEMARKPETWTYTLSPRELAEIEAARSTVAASGMDIAGIQRGDFPLPTLGARLDDMHKELLHGRGFVLIRGLPVGNRPTGESATAFLGIGAYFGGPRSQNAKGHVLGHVRDLGLSAEKDPTVRIYQTTERQTFHTDSCDVVALLCLKTARSGGFSSITSSMSIYNIMARRRPDLARCLFEPFSTDRRGEVPEGKKPFFDIPVFNDHKGYLSVIYARRYIQSGQRFEGARRLSNVDLEALDYFDSLANDPDLRLDMEFRPGDIQLLHNHTILHDRTAYVDWNEPERKRHLLRLWLSPPDARPLPDVYAERYGSITPGDRGGIICKGTRPHAPLQPT
jgi:TfdA family taurine catabolism dioxygenase TauD